jgi:hypothetical protein
MSIFIVISLDFGSKNGQDFLLWLEFTILGLQIPQGHQKACYDTQKGQIEPNKAHPRATNPLKTFKSW